MKFSLAATTALLGHTVAPALSKRHGDPFMALDGGLGLTPSREVLKPTSSQSKFFPNYDEQKGMGYKRRFRRNVAGNLKNARSGDLKAKMVPCDPRSTDADIGILSCGMGHVCEPSPTTSLGGVCTPLKASSQDHDQGTEQVQCDPSSIDIGILGCEDGQFCQPDETSGLGGVCIIDSRPTYNNRRQLVGSLSEYVEECEPWPPADPVVFCDCSDLNLTTGTGTMSCAQNITSLLVQGCDEYVVYDVFLRTFNDSVFVKYDDCYETKAPFTEKICFHYYLEDITSTEFSCYAEWNGQRCNSCEKKPDYYLPIFDCSNVDGGRSGDSRKELLSVFDLCSNTTCTNLCGEGSSIPDSNFDTYITGYNVTCGLIAHLEENEHIFDYYCPYYSELAQKYCCLQPNSTDAGGDSATPSPEPTDNATIPEGSDGEGNASTLPPEAETGGENNDGSSAAVRQTTIVRVASMTCQAALLMVLSSGV